MKQRLTECIVIGMNMNLTAEKRYILVQTSIGDYRQVFIDRLVQQFGSSLTILCGRDYFYPSLKTGVTNHQVHVMARNIFLLRRKILLQLGVQLPAIGADVAVLEYNPRILNTWIVSMVRRILGRRTILWGHVYSRSGKDHWARRSQRALANGLIVYTEEQKRILIEELRYGGEAYAAPNALYADAEMQPVDNIVSRNSFIYVGRLVKDKKPSLMISAFAAATPGLPSDSKLLIAGDGPERPGIEKLIARLGISDRVQMFGHVAGYSQVRTLYQQSLASLSPGYVGLSITQSLGFGVPMIYSRNEPHAPEIVAAKEGWNSLTFQTDSYQDLSEKMIQIYQERVAWNQRTSEIALECRRNFSVEKMVQEFVRAIHGPEA